MDSKSKPFEKLTHSACQKSCSPGCGFLPHLARRGWGGGLSALLLLALGETLYLPCPLRSPLRCSQLVGPRTCHAPSQASLSLLEGESPCSPGSVQFGHPAAVSVPLSGIPSMPCLRGSLIQWFSSGSHIRIMWKASERIRIHP